jgi:signal transduction histidine kinase
VPEALLEDSIEAATRQTRRLATLVDDLLDVSRITAGRLALELEPVDLAQVTEEVLSHFAAEAERARCQVTLHTEGSVVGRWDRSRLEQVVTNLLGNAVKYGAGAPIDLSVAARDGMARLKVQDHGIGIAPERQARIFEQFERAVSSRHYGGLGLGLFIVRRIVESLGGSVGVESALEAGSTFTVELPLTGPST